MRADDDHPGLLFGNDSWSWAEVVAESAGRAAVAEGLRRPGPFHVGVLLDNGPEYLFWLGGAALSGATVVGINPTRRGAELARDISHTDCQLIVTDPDGRQTLAGLDTGVPDDRILVVDANSRGNRGRISTPISSGLPDASSLIVLLFTSGSTGAPKAVKCSQRQLAAVGQRASELYGFRRDDVCYCSMPLFHGNAVMAVWAPALTVGATFATRPKFSASNFLPDIRLQAI